MSAHTTIIEETPRRNLNIDSQDCWPDKPPGLSLSRDSLWLWAVSDSHRRAGFAPVLSSVSFVKFGFL